MTVNSPIFVTGYQRSGTTLLGNILDRHPRLGIFVESFFIPAFYFTQVLYWPLRHPRNRIRLAKAIMSERAWIANGVECDAAEVVAGMSGSSYADLLNALMTTWAEKRGKLRWGDKSPGYITKLHVLHRLYPDAKVVHIVRDGRDVWLSLKRLDWERNVVKVARDWGRSVEEAQHFGQRRLGKHYMEIRYEDLTARPGPVMRSVFRFLGEEYTDEVLKPGRGSSPNQALQDWPRIHDRIDGANSRKWLHEMPRRDLALFEDQTGSVLRDHGYPLVHKRIATRCDSPAASRRLRPWPAEQQTSWRDVRR